MELTKEYFDEQMKELTAQLVTKEYLAAYLDARLENYVTKDDLKMALDQQTKKLGLYMNDIAQSIIEAIDASHAAIVSKLSAAENILRQPLTKPIFYGKIARPKKA